MLPELLRIQAQALLAISPSHLERAARLLLRACRIAQRQSARSWELRAATDLTRLEAEQRGHEQARSLLATTYERFSEGFATPDLRAAAELLKELDCGGDDSVSTLGSKSSSCPI